LDMLVDIHGKSLGQRSLTTSVIGTLLNKIKEHPVNLDGTTVVWLVKGSLDGYSRYRVELSLRTDQPGKNENADVDHSISTPFASLPHFATGDRQNGSGAVGQSDPISNGQTSADINFADSQPVTDSPPKQARARRKTRKPQPNGERPADAVSRPTRPREAF
jgi:hypothetical protein